MKGNRFVLDIERFVLRADPPVLEFDGWLAAAAASRSVRLDLPGGTGLDITRAPDGDRDRLCLREAVHDDAGLDDAALVIEAENDDRLVVEIGHLLRRPDWWPRVVRFAPGPGSVLAPLDASCLADAIACGPDVIDAADLHLSQCGGHWIAVSHRTGMCLETGIEAADRQSAREQALSDMREALAAIIGTLEEGAPLLIYRRAAPDTNETMRHLFEQLRARNPDAALLWLDTHRAAGPVVRWREEGWAEAGLLLLASDDDDPDLVLAAARERMLDPR